MPEIVALVAELRNVSQYEEAVCKALGNEELLLVLLCKKNAVPLSLGGTSASQVNSNVKNAALDSSYQLGLREMLLEVESAENSLC